MLYNTGLLVGRAYALAHDPWRTVREAVDELHGLAAGDRDALEAARAHLQEFVVDAWGTEPERRALHMLSAVLERMDEHQRETLATVAG